tara:strand:+ start:75941 stop:76873 length:933 start_codon:yes stop_codon:yes gene_type:complete
LWRWFAWTLWVIEVLKYKAPIYVFRCDLGRAITLAELLHQVATTLESHINSFTKEAESQQSESQQIFDTTVSELSERLAAMEKALEEKESALDSLQADRSDLAEQLEAVQQSLTESNASNAQLVAENDGFRRQITRMASEHKESIQILQAEAKEQARESARERKRLSDEHSTALASQRKELTEAAEHTENRLMMLLDQERQAAKESAAQLRGQLVKVSDKSEPNRDRAVELEATVRQMAGYNDSLESELAKEASRSAELSVALEEQKSDRESLQREFDAYKDEYKISGDLHALQSAVTALQDKLEQRKDQ